MKPAIKQSRMSISRSEQNKVSKEANQIAPTPSMIS